MVRFGEKGGAMLRLFNFIKSNPVPHKNPHNECFDELLLLVASFFLIKPPLIISFFLGKQKPFFHDRCL